MNTIANRKTHFPYHKTNKFKKLTLAVYNALTVQTWNVYNAYICKVWVAPHPPSDFQDLKNRSLVSPFIFSKFIQNLNFSPPFDLF